MNKKRILSMVLALTMILSGSLTVFGQMNDTDKHWANEEITYMVDKGIINGYEDNTFRPDKEMTKAEFYKVISELIGSEEKVKSEFKDVKETDWFYEYVEKALGAGYIENGEYLYPNESINREEVARTIATVYDLEVNARSIEDFKDEKDISSENKKYVEALKKKGYIIGYEDGTFRPKGNITRAEVVMMVYNIMDAEGVPEKPEEPTDEEIAITAVEEFEAKVDSIEKVEELVNNGEKLQETMALFVPATNAVAKVSGEEKEALRERLDKSNDLVQAASFVDALQTVTEDLTEENLLEAQIKLTSAKGKIDSLVDGDVKDSLKALVAFEEAKIVELE